MKNMTKGALVTGLGVALLLGGGGTLAVWNADQESNAGQIASGDLNLVAGQGVWKNAAGTTVDISTYRVVPGDKLTYTQPLAVTLVGNNLAANLKVTGTGVNKGFTTNNVVVSEPVLKNAAGTVLPTTVLKSSQDVTATVTFEFKSTTTGRDSVGKGYDFSGIGYFLEQQAPASA